MLKSVFLLVNILLLIVVGKSEGQMDAQIGFWSTRDGGSDFFVMDADGSNITKIAQGDFDVMLDQKDVDWSPDGSKILFSSNRDGNREIYVMNADGSDQINLTNNDATDFGANWSPDGSKIAFVSDRDGNREIYLMNADGSNPINITNTPSDGRSWQADTGTEMEPDWSPDGSQIAFFAPVDAGLSGDGNREIFVMDADGSNRVRLTDNDSLDDTPTWSPDGTKIAFSTQRDGGGNQGREIYVMNVDGSNPIRLTDNKRIDVVPNWSPDGNKIAFLSLSVTGHPEIYVMNADGSNQVNVTNYPSGPDLHPVWIPSVQTAIEAISWGNIKLKSQ